MRKTHLVCSLLMAFGLSILISGCEPANKAGTAKPSNSKGLASTTGGGTEVPVAPSKGATEAPKVEATKSEAEPAAEEKPKAEAEPAPEKAKTEG